MDSETTKAGERRSARTKRRRESYSPELKSDSKLRKPSSKPKLTNRAHPKRLYDLMPNGEPFCCHMCRSPFVASVANKAGKKNERSRHVPLPKTCVDKATGRESVICNACAHTFDRPPTRAKNPVPAPTSEEINAYTAEVAEFTQLLKQTYNDPRVEKLFCPVSKKKLCGCLQKYIKSNGIEGAGEGSAVPYFLDLMKEAEALRKEKAYIVVNENIKSKKFIGLGNGHKKSKRYEEFVLIKRRLLKDMSLCERATQKILIYSNNFLHKKLKTENRPCRIERTRGKAAMGKLPDLHTLVDMTCCSDNCVMLALTHRKLLQDWRDRAQQGQTEARRVLAEMLTPAGASHCNCYQFISMVTGCSTTTIGRVCNQMIDTGGNRDPPEHGMKKVWQESYKKTRVSISESDEVDQPNNASQSQQTSSSRQEVTLEQASTNQMTAPSSNLSYELQQQKLALIQHEISQKKQQQLQQQKLTLIQQEISKKQQQLQQQEANLQRLAQQVSSSSMTAENWQNTAFIQQLFKQLASQNASSGNSSIEVLQLTEQLPAKTLPTQHSIHDNKLSLTTSQAQSHIVQQSQQAPDVTLTNVQWNQSSPTPTHLNVNENQSIVQLPLPGKESQLLVNQSHGPIAVNLSQCPVSQTQTQSNYAPVAFNQLPQQLTPNQAPVFLPWNQYNILVSQAGQSLNSSQVIVQRPGVNVQNILFDTSQIVLEPNQTNGNQIISSHLQQGLQSGIQQVENQSVQIQLIPCQTPTVAENQLANQQHFVDGNYSVQMQVENAPIVLSPDMIQQLINSGALQILPQMNMLRNTTDDIQETTQPGDIQESSSHNLNNFPETVEASSESVQASSVPQITDQTMMISGNIVSPSPSASNVISIAEHNIIKQGQEGPQQNVQNLTNINASVASVIQNTVSKSRRTQQERQHGSSSAIKDKKSTKQIVNRPCKPCAATTHTISFDTSSISGAVTAPEIEEVSRIIEVKNTQSYSSISTSKNVGGNIPREKNLTATTTTQFPADSSGETPSQIQISFETVIDKSGQTATSHILLPHSNVLTLPIVPVYTTASMSGGGHDTLTQSTENIAATQSTANIAATTAENSAQTTKLVQADDKAKTLDHKSDKAKKKVTRKIKEKSEHIDDVEKDKAVNIVPLEYTAPNKGDGETYIHSRKGSADMTESERMEYIQNTSQTGDYCDYEKPDNVFPERLRHGLDLYDKSRHSSGSSIRSRQSSGNSESLRPFLAFDTLRPLSGMSDILERSRQFSGNSQVTARSRTSSGNSYLNEQIHVGGFQTISPSAMLNKEKGVFFVSTDADLGEINSLHMPDHVHHISDFILSAENISELHSQTFEAFVENQSQSHAQTGPLSEINKSASVVESIDSQSHVQTDYRYVMKQSQKVPPDISSDVQNQSHIVDSYQDTPINVDHAVSRGKPEFLAKQNLHETQNDHGGEFYQDHIIDQNQMEESNHYQLLNQSEGLQVSQSHLSYRHDDRDTDQPANSAKLQTARSLLVPTESDLSKTPVLNSLLMKPPKFITWSQSSDKSTLGGTDL